MNDRFQVPQPGQLGQQVLGRNNVGYFMLGQIAPFDAVAQTVVDACLEQEYEEGFVALGVEEILKRC